MRRTMRVVALVGLVASVVGFGGRAVADDGRADRGGCRAASPRQTEAVVRELFHRRELADVNGVWDLVADGGVITFPFTGDRALPPTVYRKPQDEAAFKAGIGPLLASLSGLHFTNLVFSPLAERGGTVVTYDAAATVSFTGKVWDARLLTEAHVRCGQVTSYTEYYDPAVLLEALTP